MLQRSTIEVKDKIFSIESIVKLRKIFYEKYTQSKKQNHKNLIIELVAEDGSSFNFEDDDLEQEFTELISDKKISKIYLYFKDYTEVNSLILALREGDYTNVFEISSKNKKWFDETRSQVNDYLSSLESQYVPLSNNKKIIFHFSALIFGFLVINSAALVIGLFIENPDIILNSDLESFIDKWQLLILPTLYYINGLFCMTIIFNKLKKYWPSIEFNFGPEYKRSYIKQRNRAKKYAELAAIPLIIGLIIAVVQVNVLKFQSELKFTSTYFWL